MILKKLNYKGAQTATCECKCDTCGKLYTKNIYVAHKRTFCSNECYLKKLKECKK